MVKLAVCGFIIFFIYLLYIIRNYEFWLSEEHQNTSFYSMKNTRTPIFYWGKYGITVFSVLIFGVYGV